MAFQRQIAFRLNLADLFVTPFQKEENAPGYLDVLGQKVKRVCIMGTVVGKFVSDDTNYASLTIDDSTETIRLKVWRDDTNLVDKVSEINVGDTVDIIGRVRMYNDELYISPELVVKVEDPNAFISRKLEIIKLKKILPTLNLEGDEEQASGGDALSLIEKGFNTLEKMKGNSDLTEEDIKTQILSLMDRGDIYEPKKGVYEKV